MEASSDSLMRYATILVTEENSGGDSFHPISSLVGMATRGGSPGKFVNGVVRLRDTNDVMWNW